MNVMQEGGPVCDWPHISVLHINWLPPAAPASMILQHIMHCQYEKTCNITCPYESSCCTGVLISP
jgi:hypothetical protein